MGLKDHGHRTVSAVNGGPLLLRGKGREPPWDSAISRFAPHCSSFTIRLDGPKSTQDTAEARDHFALSAPGPMRRSG
jgi:hypothetical protein